MTVEEEVWRARQAGPGEAPTPTPSLPTALLNLTSALQSYTAQAPHQQRQYVPVIEFLQRWGAPALGRPPAAFLNAVVGMLETVVTVEGDGTPAPALHGPACNSSRTADRAGGDGHRTARPEEEWEGVSSPPPHTHHTQAVESAGGSPPEAQSPQHVLCQPDTGFEGLGLEHGGGQAGGDGGGTTDAFPGGQ